MIYKSAGQILLYPCSRSHGQLKKSMALNPLDPGLCGMTKKQSIA
jgi:hypothetical protein